MLKRFLQHVVFGVGLTLILSVGAQGEILDQEATVLPEIKRLFRILENFIRVRNKALPFQERLSSEMLDQVFQSSEFSLDDLNTIAQKIFLCPPNFERRALLNQKEDPSLKAHKAELLEIFQGIGDLKAVEPKGREYSYILLNGSTVPNMRERLKTLISYVKKGKLNLRQSTLIFLTSKRALFKDKYGNAWEQKALYKIPADCIDPCWTNSSKVPKTEAQAMEWIWKQTKLPPSLRALKPILIAANPQKDQSGNFRRPNTFDTVSTWIEKTQPTPGFCLSISSQPFVFYQQEAISYTLQRSDPRRFIVEGVGDAPSKSYIQKPGIFRTLLDNFARVLWIERELQKNKIHSSETDSPKE